MIGDLMLIAGVAALLVMAGWLFLAPDRDADDSATLSFFDTTNWSDLDESSHHDRTGSNRS